MVKNNLIEEKEINRYHWFVKKKCTGVKLYKLLGLKHTSYLLILRVNLFGDVMSFISEEFNLDAEYNGISDFS